MKIEITKVVVLRGIQSTDVVNIYTPYDGGIDVGNNPRLVLRTECTRSQTLKMLEKMGIPENLIEIQD